MAALNSSTGNRILISAHPLTRTHVEAHRWVTYWSGAALGSRPPFAICVLCAAQSWPPGPFCTAARAPGVTGSSRAWYRGVISRRARTRLRRPGLRLGPCLFTHGILQFRHITNRDTRS
jgi:hypothetical protein